MRPDDPQMKHPSLFVPQRPHAPQSDDTRVTQPVHQEAAANLARTQIDAIYGNDPNTTMEAPEEPEPTPVVVQPSPASDISTQSAESKDSPRVITNRKEQYAPQKPFSTTDLDDSPENPYARSHDESKLQTSSDSWSEYHSAWQKYYKEYFQRYYAGHLHESQAAFEAQSERVRQLEQQTTTNLTPEQAMDDLRSQLRTRIKERGKKIRKSRHFMPIMAAAAVMVAFLFLQYNRVIFAYANAYISPGSVNPDNIIVDPNQDVVVSAEPRLIIPKINVDIEAIYDDTMGNNQQETYDKQMTAMEQGVAWFGIDGANSHPGQNGNTVLSGHSSNDWFDLGDVKFVFATLDRLKADDVIYLNYKSTRYTYQVTETKVVLPSELSALQLGNDKPMLTLITCTPLGTSEKRLLVFAEQISPDPVAAEAAPGSSSTNSSTEIPGVESSFLGGLFD